jgi:type 1 glutamine amidotransferase
VATWVLALLLGVACENSNSPRVHVPGVPPDQSGTPAVLVFTKTAGFRHGSILDGVLALRQIAADRDWLLNDTEDASSFSASVLQDYDVVVWLNTTGDVLDADQQLAFEDFIQAGGGFVGVHSATDTEYDWAWYGDLVGAYFAGHPAVQSGVVHVDDPAHAIASGVPDPWMRTDEWYNFDRNPRSAVTVLMTLDESSYSGGSMGDHPIAWFHEYDGGRAFYTAMGHTSGSFAEVAFLDHLAAAIEWAAGF